MKKTLLVILCAIQTCFSFAAAVSFSAKISHNTVEVGQRIQVTFTVNSSGGSFTPPSFQKFRVLSGPNQSNSMQYVNGKTSRTTSISYVLQATQKGSFEFGPATIKVEGKTYKTKPLKIKVVDASSTSSNAQRNKQNQRKSDGQRLEDYVYIKTTVDKREAYIGEKVTASFKLYSKLSLTGINIEALPALNGFWSQDIRSYDQIQLSREQINGEIYNVAELQQVLLYPQRSGELVIDPLEMNVTVQVKSRRTRSVFEQMFGSYETKELIAKSNLIKIKVKPLPKKNKPEDFSGAIGSFNMKMTSNKDSVVANEAIDVKIEISGKGNLPLIGAPDLNFPSDFEVYDPESKDNFQISLAGAQGKKNFNYLVIPRHSGKFKLDPFHFSYFDLKSKTYKTITAKPIEINVSKGEEGENVAYSSSRKEEVELLNTDIRYIHINNLMLASTNDFFYGSPLFYSLIGLAFLIMIAAYFISKKLKIKNSDTVGLRKSKANKLAKKRLAKAKNYLDKDESALFHEEISAALYGYFADKFNISIADLSQEKISELLKKIPNTTEVQLKIKSVLEEAEMARFAPTSSIDNVSLYNKSVEIISIMEDVNV